MDKTDEDAIGAPSTDYGNWISKRCVRTLGMVTAIVGAAFLLCEFAWGNTVVTVISGILLLVMLYVLCRYLRVREALSYSDGEGINHMHTNLLSHLHWDGQGHVLDVGCGSGALTIRCAKAYPICRATGMDTWSSDWEYSQAQCEKNAQLEGVNERCKFVAGDVRALAFPDETFDALVDNLVLSKVKSANTIAARRALIAESLRVLKTGGAFVFQEPFDNETMFGTADELISWLQEQGISEVHYEGNLDHADWMPSRAVSSLSFKGLGVLWGQK